MNRYAWLEFNGRTWHLLTSNPENAPRSWDDKGSALSDLAEEGWRISGPFPKRQGLDPTSNQSSYGFILSRAVQ
jgi:hypothetical protein